MPFTIVRQDITKMNIPAIVNAANTDLQSVLKYVGESTGGIGGFTHGRYYYWPCSVEEPEYEGVIDDEEFTSYLANIGHSDIAYQLLEEAGANGVKGFASERDIWEIVEDPTGMAARVFGLDIGGTYE